VAKEAVFTLKIDPELRDEFMAEAAAADRPASQVVRELMRDFVRRQREARDYDEYLHEKVGAARKSVRAGLGRPHEDVAADAKARRRQLPKRADETGL
jgi:predicted transcriptional regulator